MKRFVSSRESASQKKAGKERARRERAEFGRINAQDVEKELKIIEGQFLFSDEKPSVYILLGFVRAAAKEGDLETLVYLFEQGEGSLRYRILKRGKNKHLLSLESILTFFYDLEQARASRKKSDIVALTFSKGRKELERILGLESNFLPSMLGPEPYLVRSIPLDASDEDSSDSLASSTESSGFY